MKLKLSDWASIAEIIAAIGVVFSLIFVGLQINEGNQETRAATIQATHDAEAFMVATLVNHSDTWDKVVTGAPLESGAEMRKGINLYNFLMVDTENRFHQFHSGFLDAPSWEGRLFTLQPIVKLPMFKIWRESFGAKGHSAEFLELLDNLAEEAPVE
jgi:hypothetical protein